MKLETDNGLRSSGRTTKMLLEVIYQSNFLDKPPLVIAADQAHVKVLQEHLNDILEETYYQMPHDLYKRLRLGFTLEQYKARVLGNIQIKSFDDLIEIKIENCVDLNCPTNTDPGTSHPVKIITLSNKSRGINYSNTEIFVDHYTVETHGIGVLTIMTLLKSN